MRWIAKITFQHHEVEPPLEPAAAARAQRVLHLYQVIGKSQSVACRLCRQGVAGSALQPSVAITVEGLNSLGKGHIPVCKSVKRACEALNRTLHLCGVTAENRNLLADAGLLEGIDSQNIHHSIAALLPGLCNNPAPRQSRRQPIMEFRPIAVGQDILGLRHGRAVL